MRNDPKILLRGLAKFVAVVVAAALAGALIGIGLAKLSGDDDGGAAALAPTTAIIGGGAADTTQTVPTETETTTAPSTQTQTQPTTTPKRSFLVPRVQVLSARLIPAEGADGVTVRVKVTNRASRPLKMTGPVLISGEDEIALDVDAAARPLPRTLAPDKSATGTLRFNTSPAVTKRLTDNRSARLRIATRTIAIKLTPPA